MALEDTTEGRSIIRAFTGHDGSLARLREPGATARLLVIPIIRGTATTSPDGAALAERLAPWIAEQGIAEGEIAVAVAGSLVTSGGLDWVARSFGDGTGSQVLRDAAAGLASDAHLSLDEWAADNYWHGHGKRY